MRDPRVALRSFLKRRFYAVGRWVGTSPWTTIAAVLLLSFAVTPALINARWESRIEYLYVPTEAESFHGTVGSPPPPRTAAGDRPPPPGQLPPHHTPPNPRAPAAAHTRHPLRRPTPQDMEHLFKTFGPQPRLADGMSGHTSSIEGKPPLTHPPTHPPTQRH